MNTKRLYYLDWLRVIAILAVLLLHVAKMFDFHTTIVANTQRSLFLSAFRDFVLIWVMPLFFVVSGAAVFLSGKLNQPRKFIKVRFMRLIVPLLFVGTFLINPVYVYVERLSQGSASVNFFQWYPQFFQGIYGLGGNFAPLGNGTYLWYLQFLFVYSLILLPLFVVRKKLGSSYLSKVSSRFNNIWSLLLLFVPISIFSVLFEIIGLGGMRVMGGWDLLSYLCFYAYGYMIFSNPKILALIKKHNPIILGTTLVLTYIYLDSHFGINLVIPAVTRHDLANGGALRPLNLVGWLSVLSLKGLLSWLWVLGILGSGEKLLNFKNRFLVYANEAVLPFYILHHAVVYVVGFYVLQWSVGIWSKFLAITLFSVMLIMLIYELLIKRISLVRFLFGMKPKTIRRKNKPHLHH